MRVMDLLPVRLLLSAVLALKVFDNLLPAALTIAYRSERLGLAQWLAGFTPGDDYRRFIPLMDVIPTWMHVLAGVAGSLYLLAIGMLLFRNVRAYVPVLIAFAIEVIAHFLGKPIIEASGVVVHPNESILVSVVFPFVLPLLLAGVLWWAARPAPRPHSAEG
jgi:hypothetical protein